MAALLLAATAIGPAGVGAAPARPELGDTPGRPLYLPTASVSLSVPAQVLIGTSFAFTVTFDNTDPDEVGYGPFIDIVFPVTGADGAGAATDDGIDFTSATYLGAAVTSVQRTFGTANTGGCTGGLGPVNHPYAIDSSNTPLLVCGTPGDKLVTLQLPFGSFTPDQPPAVVTVNATLSSLADAGTPLTLRTRGGYQYGATPANDWCCGDVSIVSHPGTSTGWPGASVTPTVLSLSKSYGGPEDETATGPNFPRQYTITVDIATGQPVTGLTVVDTLPANMQFLSVVSTVPAAACTTPSTTTPGGTLSCNFGSVTGGAAANDATLTFSFFIPLNDASGSPVINASTGDDATSLNTSNVTGSWDPIDSRDPITPVSAGGVCPTGCHTLTDKSIAIQKSVANVVDVGVGGNSPGDTLAYTLQIQVSDFFTFQDVVVSDLISDGQRFDLGFTPTLQVNGNGFTLGAAAMDAANFTVDNSQIGNSGPGPDGTDGTQTVTFRVSDEMVTRGEAGRLIGGCVPVAGTGGPAPDCGLYNDGPTTATIVFRTIIQQDFSDTYPSGDPSVDHGDILTDDVTVSGDLLSVADNATPTGSSEADTSGATLSIAFGSLSKSVYAVNGTVCAPCTTEIMSDGVNPGDTVTFRLRYTQPSSDFEQTTLTDYLPLPIFDATTVASFDNSICGVPASGNACLGPADTYHSLNLPPVNEPNPVVVPLMTTNATSNFVRFAYADYDSVTNTSSEFDLLFTVTVSNLPFADGLFLTNQANATEGTTNAGDQALDAILQIKINEPLLIPKKSAVSTDATGGGVVFTPPIGAPIAFDVPGVVDGTADWSGGVISSNYLAANPIDADLTGVDAGDLVKFAIVIENAGNSLDGAFDIAIRDTLPPQYEIPASGLNLEVFLGDGVTSVAFTDLGGGLFGSGIQLVDPGVPPVGACQAHHPTSGENVVVITYDLQLSGSVALSQNIINTATLLSYAGTEGGPNHVPSGITDTATVTPIATPVKSFIVTSEAHTSDTSSPPRVAIGEIVRYRIEVGVPEGVVNNLRVRDNLPTGLRFLDDDTARAAFVSNDSDPCTATLNSSTLGIAPWVCGDSAVTPTFVLPDSAVSATDSTSSANYAADDNDSYGSGTDVFFKLGDLTNNDRDPDAELVVIEFNALVENISGNGTGTNRNDTATYRLNNSTVDSNVSNSVQVRVAQPAITMGKSILALPAQLDAGGQVTYRITVSNGTGSNVSTAFELVVTDTLPNALTLDPLPGSVVVTTSGSVGAVDTGFTAVNSPPSVPSQLDVRVASLAPNSSVQIDYTATINGSVTPSQLIANTGLATWTSLPGPNGTLGNPTGSDTPGNSGDANGERNGSGVGANNYRATSSQSFTSAAVSIAKLLTASSAPHTADSDLAIGEEVTYGLLLTFPEGTTASDTVVDDLPAGLEVISGTPEIITAAADSDGLLAADFSGTIGSQNITVVSGDGGSVTFTFTDVQVPGDNDTTNNTVLLRFRALVTNVAGNQGGTVLSNTATNQVGAGTPTSSNTVTATVVEPELEVSKSADDDTPGIGQTYAYTLNIEHLPGSAADAFDLAIIDPLPANVNRVTGPDVSSAPAACAGAVTDNSVGDTISLTIASLPLGCTLMVTYEAQIAVPPAAPADTFDNTATLDWTSLPGSDGGERTGAGGVDDYVHDSTATVTLTAVELEITKTDGGVTVQPGDTLAYTLDYQNLGNSPASGVVISETVPANTTFDAGASTAGWSCADGSPAGTDCQLTVDDVDIGASGSVTFAVTIDSPVPAGVTQIDNTASIADDGEQGPEADLSNNTDDETTPLDAAPDLRLTKDDGASIVSPGTTLTYTLTVENVGGQDATGVQVTDTIPANTAFVSASAGGSESGGVVSWPAFDLGGGDSVAFTVSVRVDDPFPLGVSTIVNVARAEDDGSNGPDLTPGDNDASDTDYVVTAANNDLTKAVSATNQGFTADPSVAIGEIVTYEITFTVPPGTMASLTLTDLLERGLAFVDCQSITASIPDITTTVSGGFAQVCANPAVSSEPSASPNPADPGRRVVFDLGDVTNSGVASGTVTVLTRVVVLDSVENQEGLALNNAATLQWTSGSLTAAATEAVIVEPDMELEKSADTVTAPPGSVITFTLTLRQSDLSDANAYDLVLSDTLPTGLSYVPGSLSLVSGPAGGVIDDSAAPALSVTWAAFPLLTGLNRTEAAVEFQAVMGALGPGQGVTNTAFLEWSSLPGDVSSPQSVHNALSTERRYDPGSPADVYQTTASIVIRVPELPDTGFPPGRVTALPDQPADYSYSRVGGLRLQIPSLGVGMPIVGIPLAEDGWDLTWLSDQAGWLEGTAYPTWAGNSALTAHATTPDGLPGPFARLGELRWGDRVVLQAFGREYVYEVRQVRIIRPTDLSVLRHEELDWLTLLSCAAYDERRESYLLRVAVRAVLMEVR